MSDFFISYEKSDLTTARTLAQTLRERGWTVFWDREIKLADDWLRRIETELKVARLVVVLWSKTSVHSNYVRDEAARALKRRVLVPILIDDVELPLGFGSIQAGNLVGWNGAATSATFRDLILALEKKVRPQPKPRIYFCYRHRDAVESTDRIRKYLMTAVGDAHLVQVPLEGDMIELTPKLLSCDVLVAIIGPNWSSTVDPHGGERRRFVPTIPVTDRVVVEIGMAFQLGIPVVPVLVDRARMPTPYELDPSLGPLAERHAVAIRNEEFESSMADLDIAIATSWRKRSGN